MIVPSCFPAERDGGEDGGQSGGNVGGRLGGRGGRLQEVSSNTEVTQAVCRFFQV